MACLRLLVTSVASGLQHSSCLAVLPFFWGCLYPASVLCVLVNSSSFVHRVSTWPSQVDGKYPVESGNGAGTQWTLSVLCL